MSSIAPWTLFGSGHVAWMAMVIGKPRLSRYPPLPPVVDAAHHGRVMGVEYWDRKPETR